MTCVIANNGLARHSEDFDFHNFSHRAFDEDDKLKEPLQSNSYEMSDVKQTKDDSIRHV